MLMIDSGHEKEPLDVVLVTWVTVHPRRAAVPRRRGQEFPNSTGSSEGPPVGRGGLC
jgi:hypothetical protein